MGPFYPVDKINPFETTPTSSQLVPYLIGKMAKSKPAKRGIFFRCGRFLVVEVVRFGPSVGSGDDRRKRDPHDRADCPIEFGLSVGHFAIEADRGDRRQQKFAFEGRRDAAQCKQGRIEG